MNLQCMGQPTRAQLEEAQAAGCTTIINLRGAAEFDEFDERELVESLGMRYVHLPVAGAGGVTAERAREFADALAAAGDCHVIAHCASANRVGALLAIGAWQDGAAPDAAIEVGKRHGLASLEDRVREVMAG